ncbi:MAG: hypothetical protein WAW96_16735 [Alphaproteobacteria bacterium]
MKKSALTLALLLAPCFAAAQQNPQAVKACNASIATSKAAGAAVDLANMAAQAALLALDAARDASDQAGTALQRCMDQTTNFEDDCANEDTHDQKTDDDYQTALDKVNKLLAVAKIALTALETSNVKVCAICPQAGMQVTNIRDGSPFCPYTPL